MSPHIFLDCDGVLADFDTYAQAYFGMNPRAYEAQVGSARFWELLEAKGDFYRNLPVMHDARELYEGVKHLRPTILTGCPRGNWAESQKVAWAHEHFPGVPIITCRSADKRVHAKPGDVLIDDWHQHRHRWIEMGGVFITHTDAATSLAALWAHFPQMRLPDDGPGHGTEGARQSAAIKQQHANAEYIAAANPDQVISLIAEIEALREGGWQPIETAPKDGTAIIMFEPGGAARWFIGEGRWVDDGGWWRTNNDPTDHWGDEIYPTHWRPLPPPPALNKEAQP